MGMNGSTMLEPLRQGLPPLDPSTVSNAASCALPARYEAVREARQFTRGTLNQWDVGDRFDDVCLVVSELVTNALRHGLPANIPRTVGQEAPVRLHLMRWTERLVCAVRDPSHETPVARETEDFAAESGRGLFLVDSFADSWGWHPSPTPQPGASRAGSNGASNGAPHGSAFGGKVVWALFRLPMEPRDPLAALAD
ncbi:ATP-binding protein [Streptomyces bluensis]|uniref:ATP-binding protein n=1 Tax=Streptomyces bluensis TaxID=33897 RepID=UPI003D9F17AD